MFLLRFTMLSLMAVCLKTKKAKKITLLSLVSGRQDSNLRPPGPKPGALPGCATPRKNYAKIQSGRQDSNLRPPGPKPGALPGCATPRKNYAKIQSGRQDSNLRPPGPKPGALPGCATPRSFTVLRNTVFRQHSRIAVQRYNYFSTLPNFSGIF